MTTATALLNKFAQGETKTKGKTNENRVEHGQLFMQPTKNGQNFAFCYYGMRNKAGEFTGGFNMSNKAMLESVEAGLLSKDFLALFEQYANKYATSQVVLK